MRDLESFEKKHVVLGGDPRYLLAWGRLADGFYSELQILKTHLARSDTPVLEEVDRNFLAYVDAFGSERSPLAFQTTAASLDRLSDRIYSSLERANRDSTELERRTWNAVLFALAAGVVAALLSSAPWWRHVAYWTLALGLLSSLLTVSTGFLAYVSLGERSPAAADARRHMALMSAALVLGLSSLLVRGRPPFPVGARFLGAAGLGALCAAVLMVGSAGPVVMRVVGAVGSGSEPPLPSVISIVQL